MDSKDSALIKMFLYMRPATMACGGHRWSWVVEKKVLGFGWAFGEKKSQLFQIVLVGTIVIKIN